MIKDFKRAFTLAEVLIVIAIIGIVAAVVGNTLLAEVGEKVDSAREANIAQKITKAVELMAAKGDYEHFDDTIDFVRALSKYLKMVKICDSEHLRECWPSEKVVTAEGEKYEVKNAKTGFELYTGYASNNAAFVMADGASVIMSFDPAESIPKKKLFKTETKILPIGDGKTEEFAYTSDVMKAIDFVMDVNGAEGPNAETDSNGTYNDIRSFRRAAFSRMSPEVAGQPICTVRYGNLCAYVMTSYNPVDCTNDENSTWCPHRNTYEFDYYAGARKACKAMNMSMADVSMIQSLAGSVTLPSNTYIANCGAGDCWCVNSSGVRTSWCQPNGKFTAICVSYLD